MLCAQGRRDRIARQIARRGEVHGVVWRLPAYNIVHNILTNPIYAGAYAFGRHDEPDQRGGMSQAR